MSIKIDRLVRSRRKTVGLEITPHALLIVRAPWNLSQEEINEVVNNESSWILRKQNFFKQNYDKIKEKDFVDGEEFLYLGRAYKLRIVDIKDHVLLLNNNSFHLSKDCIDNAKQIIESWYQKRACEVVSERTAYYSYISGIEFSRVNITNARKRWGSCSPSGNINIAWRLVMAPARVIDYVIVHELSHIEIRNHSKRFWHRVESVIPDYKKDEKWLRDNGHFLVA